MGPTRSTTWRSPVARPSATGSRRSRSKSWSTAAAATRGAGDRAGGNHACGAEPSGGGASGEQVATRVDEGRHEAAGVVEARAHHRPADRAGGDALADNRELEEGEGLEPVDGGDVEAGVPGVALDHLVARGETL